MMRKSDNSYSKVLGRPARISTACCNITRNIVCKRSKCRLAI